MSSLVHNISIRVIEKDEQKLESINQTFNQILPVDFKKEKIKVNHDVAEGFEDKNIHIFFLKLSKNRHQKLLLNNIFKKIDKEDKKKIFEQRKTRVDDQGHFYFRLDKDQLNKHNVYRLVEHGDCYHFKIKLAAYPSNKENIMKSLDSLLSMYGCNQ